MNHPIRSATSRSSRRPQRVIRPALRPSPVRRRAAEPAPPPITAGQIDTWLLQGLILAAMGAMLAWFHAPLEALFRAVF